MSITIRAWREQDIPATTALRNLPGVRWGTLATPFESQAVGRAHFEKSQQREDRVLVACDGARVIAIAGLHGARSARRAHAAGLGICVHDDYHGQGVGTQLFAALTELADNWLGLKRLELNVYTDNLPALALYKKFGFEIEGIQVAEAFRAGAYADSYKMARLRGELKMDTSPYPAPPPPAPSAPWLLRAAEPEDLPALAEMMNLPGIRHGTLRTPFITEAGLTHLTTPVDPSTRNIVAVAAGVAIGIVTLMPGKNRKAHSGDMALISVHDAWAGRGVGKALLVAALDLADNWLNLQRVTLQVFADNKAALALYEGLGFIRECTLRADAFRNGGYVDAYAMARRR